jgi:hypothetical protein
MISSNALTTSARIRPWTCNIQQSGTCPEAGFPTVLDLDHVSAALAGLFRGLADELHLARMEFYAKRDAGMKTESE